MTSVVKVALARHDYQHVSSKTLTCQFKGRILVVLTQPDQPRYALRAQNVKTIEHLNGKLKLLWGAEALPSIRLSVISI